MGFVSCPIVKMKSSGGVVNSGSSMDKGEVVQKMGVSKGVVSGSPPPAKAKKPKNILIPVVLSVLVLILLWYSFARPSVKLSNWKISNNDGAYGDTLMPHYSYHTIIPYIYFKGDLLVPEGLEEHVMHLSVDGCFMEVKVNNQVAYSNQQCNTTILHDERDVDLTGKLGSGRNEVYVKVMFDGGTTRFEIAEDIKYNLLRFSLITILLSALVYYYTRSPRHVFSVLLASLVFLCVFSQWFPVNWGYNALQAFPWRVGFILALIAIAVAVPFSYDTLADGVLKVHARLMQKFRPAGKSKPGEIPALRKELDSAKKYLLYFLVSLFSFIVFWVFRTRHSAGDSGFVGQIALDKIHMFFATSPLTAWALSFSYKLLRSIGFTFSSYDSVSLVSCFVGAVSIPALWVICRELFDSDGKRVALFSITVSAYFMQLFFGYVEFYPMLLASMIYYTLASVYYLKDKASILLPSVAFAVMFFLHLSSGYLGFSLLLLYVYKVYERKEGLISGFLKMSLSILILMVLFFGYVIFVNNDCSLGFAECIKDYVNALKGSDPGFFRTDIFTLNFIQEILTEYIYVAPGALILLFFLTAFYRRNINYKDSFLLFTLLSTFGYFLYTITHMTGTGLPNDWDVLAPIGLPMTMLAGYALLTAVEDKKLLYYYAISTVIVVVLVHTVPTLLDSADMENVLTNPIGAFFSGLRGLFQSSVGLVSPQEVSLILVDSVDVGSNVSEMSHSYAVDGQVSLGSHKTTYQNGTVIEDDYRSFKNYESFIVSSIPKRGLVIVRRVKCPSEQNVRAYLHGTLLGLMEANCKNTDDMWKDIQIEAPVRLIEGSKVGLMFVSDKGEVVESYYYWFYSAE